jgi:SnoaL-like protein
VTRSASRGQSRAAPDYVAPEAVFINPIGKYKRRAAIRKFLQRGASEGIVFHHTNFRVHGGRVVNDFRVKQYNSIVAAGNEGLTVVKAGKIVSIGPKRRSHNQARTRRFNIKPLSPYDIRTIVVAFGLSVDAAGDRIVCGEVLTAVRCGRGRPAALRLSGRAARRAGLGRRLHQVEDAREILWADAGAGSGADHKRRLALFTVPALDPVPGCLEGVSQRACFVA